MSNWYRAPAFVLIISCTATAYAALPEFLGGPSAEEIAADTARHREEPEKAFYENYQFSGVPDTPYKEEAERYRNRKAYNERLPEKPTKLPVVRFPLHNNAPLESLLLGSVEGSPRKAHEIRRQASVLRGYSERWFTDGSLENNPGLALRTRYHNMHDGHPFLRVDSSHDNLQYACFMYRDRYSSIFGPAHEWEEYYPVLGKVHLAVEGAGMSGQSTQYARALLRWAARELVQNRNKVDMHRDNEALTYTSSYTDGLERDRQQAMDSYYRMANETNEKVRQETIDALIQHLDYWSRGVWDPLSKYQRMAAEAAYEGGGKPPPPVRRHQWLYDTDIPEARLDPAVYDMTRFIRSYQYVELCETYDGPLRDPRYDRRALRFQGSNPAVINSLR